MKRIFYNSLMFRLENLVLTLVKPLFVTFLLGNVFIILDVVEKPTYKEWCIGTAFLLIGGGAIKVGKGLQEKFINK